MERDAKYAQEVKKAEPKAETFCLSIILKAAEKSWQAAAWYLERKKPDEYGQRTRIAGDPLSPIPIKLILPEGGLSVKLQTD
jgi:hypothetical protein